MAEKLAEWNVISASLSQGKTPLNLTAPRSVPSCSSHKLPESCLKQSKIKFITWWTNLTIAYNSELMYQPIVPFLGYASHPLKTDQWVGPGNLPVCTYTSCESYSGIDTAVKLWDTMTMNWLDICLNNTNNSSVSCQNCMRTLLKSYDYMALAGSHMLCVHIIWVWCGIALQSQHWLIAYQ